MILPSLSRLPAPTAITFAWIGFSFAESGMNRPPEVLVSSSRRLTRMRSCSGRIFMNHSQLGFVEVSIDTSRRLGNPLG